MVAEEEEEVAEEEIDGLDETDSFLGEDVDVVVREVDDAATDFDLEEELEVEETGE